MQLITKAQLLEIVPFSSTHIARLEDAGAFPKRLKPYPGRNGKSFWVLEEVESWIQDQIEKRDKKATPLS